MQDDCHRLILTSKQQGGRGWGGGGGEMCLWKAVGLPLRPFACIASAPAAEVGLLYIAAPCSHLVVDEKHVGAT